MYVDRGSLAAPDAWHLDRVVAADSENAGRARCAETIEVHVYSDLGTVAQEWQAFEKRADCTVFQVFHWLLKWQQHIGARTGTIPAVVLGRDSDGKVLFIFPLAIVAGGLARRLIWLGSDVCDYNAPLLADEFSRRISPDGFVGMWRRIIELIGKQPGLQFDVIDLQKMPERVGAQWNPFVALQVIANPSGAHLATLGEDWDAFYGTKRSAPTRRRDRRKLKELAEQGEIHFLDVRDDDHAKHTVDTLIGQKTRALARIGVQHTFARPGYRDFLLDVATDPGMRGLVHFSRTDVGSTIAAVSLGLRFRARYYLVLTSYQDGALSRLSPGDTHLRELLRLAINQGFRRFDFTIGDEPYKRYWCDTELRLYDHLAAATPRGWLIVAKSAAVRRAKRLIKQTPILWNAFTAARALAGPWWQSISRGLRRPVIVLRRGRSPEWR